MSSPWENSEEDSIIESIWPLLYKAWLDKEQWAGCQEITEEVQLEWNQAQLCLKAYEGLGSAEPAVLSIFQLYGSQIQWMHLDELTSRQCHLSQSEYATLTSWISTVRSQTAKTSAEVSEIPRATADVAPYRSSQGVELLQQQRNCSAALRRQLKQLKSTLIVGHHPLLSTEEA